MDKNHHNHKERFTDVVIVCRRELYKLRGKNKSFCTTEIERPDCELKEEFKAVGLCLSEGLVIFRFVPLDIQPGNHHPAGTLDISGPYFPLQGHGGECE